MENYIDYLRWIALSALLAGTMLVRGSPSLGSGEQAVQRSFNNQLQTNGIAVDREQKPATEQRSAKNLSIDCVNNLKMIGLAFKMWSLDHDDQFPFNISTNGGQGTLRPYGPGTKEFCSRDTAGFDTSAPLVFQVMSNGLASTTVLICPADSKKAAVDFEHLGATNVSYRIRSGPEVSDIHPQNVLAKCPIHGHVLLCDGSVSMGR